MSKNSTYLRVAKRNKKSNDRAKLQIKSEKPLLLEDIFGSWSKSADTDTDSPKFRNPTIEGKRVKEKVYIYIYINIKIYY